MHLRLLILSLILLAFLSLVLGVTTKANSGSATTKKAGTTKAGTKTTSKSPTTKKAGTGTTKKSATTKKAGTKTTKKSATTKKAGTKKTTTKPVVRNCNNTISAIINCSYQLGRNNPEYVELWLYYDLCNASGLTALLTKWKDKGCIAADAWPDVEWWLTILLPPPKCVTNAYNKLTAKQKNALMKRENISVNYNQKTEDTALAAYATIANKVKNFTAADYKKTEDWLNAYEANCYWRTLYYPSLMVSIFNDVFGGYY